MEQKRYIKNHFNNNFKKSNWVLPGKVLFSRFSRVQLFCDPMDCSPPGFSTHEDSPGKNTGVDCHFLLQGIFPTQGSNLHLLH